MLFHTTWEGCAGGEVEVDLPSGERTFILLSSSLCNSPEKFALPKCKLLVLPDGTECPPSYANNLVDLAEKKHRVLAAPSLTRSVIDSPTH